MIDANQVEYPAECYISFQGDSVTAPCMVHLSTDDQYAYVLFSHSAGVLGFSGTPRSNGTIRLIVMVADEATAPSTGSCHIEASTANVTCSGTVGNDRLTIRAKARMQF